MKPLLGLAVLSFGIWTFVTLQSSSASPPSPQALVEDATKRYIQANLLRPGWIIEKFAEVRPLMGDPRFEAYCATFKNQAAYDAAFLNKGRTAGMLMHHCIVSVNGAVATVENCTTGK